MKAKIYIPLIAMACLLPACVEDEGNYSYTPINEIEIDGIEESYSGMAYSDVIEINPTITGSLRGEDISNYEFTWYRCGSNHTHDTISHDINLYWPANAYPGTHTFYLSIKDKETGLEKNVSTSVQLSSPFTRGFLVFGNRPNSGNLVGLDMLSIITGKNDTIYAKDVFDNSEHQLRNAKALIYTGNNRQNRFYLQTEDATYNPYFSSEFETLGKEFNDMSIIECLEPHKIPMKLVDVGMKQGVHMASSLSMQPRIYLTEDLVFGHKANESMNQALNRYGAYSKIYYKFYPYIFYNTRKRIAHLQNDYSGQYSPIFIYDTENDCFAFLTGTALGLTHSVQVTNTVVLQQNNIYMMNQPNGRKLVYGENDYYRSNGRCNAIMKDKDDKYFLYRFVLGMPGMGFASQPSIKEPYGCELNIADMTNFLQREQIFFASGAASQIYYSVGNTLYAYDYVSKKLGSKQFNGHITYLAPEVCSISNETSHYWVATFDGNKGHLYKMQTVDNPNQIEFKELPGQDWEVDLEIKSVLWKSGAFLQ